MSTEYGADQIQILEGLEAVRKKTWNVHWEHIFQRVTSSCIRNCRQCGR